MKEILKNEIKDVTIRLYENEEKENLIFKTDRDRVKILICFKGEFKVGSREMKECVIGLFPGSYIEIFATDFKIAEIEMEEKGNYNFLKKEPYIMEFKDGIIYKEDIKSDKTKNMFLLQDNVFENIAIGSVETKGPDIVKKHNHPDVDQIFITKKNNNMKVIIDNIKVPLKEFEIIHIPLGSNHEITADKGEYINYIWIDFILNKRGKTYMKNAHSIEKSKDN